MMEYEKTTDRAIHAINEDNKFLGSIRLLEDGWKLSPIEHHGYTADELSELAEKLNVLNSNTPPKAKE